MTKDLFLISNLETNRTYSLTWISSTSEILNPKSQSIMEYPLSSSSYNLKSVWAENLPIESVPKGFLKKGVTITGRSLSFLPLPGRELLITGNFEGHQDDVDYINIIKLKAEGSIDKNFLNLVP